MSTAPFDATAQGYDLEFTETQVGRMQRACTYAWLQDHIKKHAPLTVLELNCGTGEDARWLGKQGLVVTATDLSAEMVSMAKQKTAGANVTVLQMGIQDIARHFQGQQFDLIWSNFGGFNCLSPDEIKAVGTDIQQLLKPGGFFVAVVMGRFCAWESLYFLAKFKPGQAFRRFGKGPVQARLRDGHFQATWYYSPGEFEALVGDGFATRSRMAVGAYLPPSYLDPFFARRPGFLRRLNAWEQSASKSAFPARFSDHFLVAFQRK